MGRSVASERPGATDMDALLLARIQFGTNWSEFSRFAGGITGPLLTYEVLTAFFLEAGFLGVMLFGMQRVGPGLHFVSTLAVAVGTLVSSTWILASNSWMHTPQGHEIITAAWCRSNGLPSSSTPRSHTGCAAAATSRCA